MALLSIDNLVAGYGPVTVLHGVTLHVDEGETVAVLGANGAGKSTLLRAVSRLIPVLSGAIAYKNKSIISSKPHDVAAMGISHVPEGRAVFGNLTVLENLRLATFANKTSSEMKPLLASVFEMFPVLGQRQRQIASTLSGGEQQMLAIGRAMVSDGELFILDEPSMGLSPLLVKNVFAIIAALNKKGKTILLVEQNAAMALNYCRRAYVLENGRAVASGTSAEIAGNAELKKAYLG
ncbi:MAG TPA: ABC transporter ATP-binding protein [Chitinivibrionales bacterium]|nr:ABC transporter ATP-binding protein [Chitinivibrionales bacterium]